MGTSLKNFPSQMDPVAQLTDPLKLINRVGELCSGIHLIWGVFKQIPTCILWSFEECIEEKRTAFTDWEYEHFYALEFESNRRRINVYQLLLNAFGVVLPPYTPEIDRK